MQTLVAGAAPRDGAHADPVVGDPDAQHARSRDRDAARPVVRAPRSDRHRCRDRIPDVRAHRDPSHRRRVAARTVARVQPLRGRGVRARTATGSCRSRASRRSHRKRPSPSSSTPLGSSGSRAVMMGGAIPRPFSGHRLAGRAMDRRPRSRVDARLHAVVGEVRRARRFADVSLDGRGLGRAHIADQLRVQSHREFCGRGRAHGAIAVLRWRSHALPATAIRVPRGRRRVGVQSAQRPPRSLGEAQPRRDRAVRPGRPRPRRNSMRLFAQHAEGRMRERIDRLADGLNMLSEPIVGDDVIDEFAESQIAGPDDIVEIFTERYFFGCEADDPMAALAFDRCPEPGRSAAPRAVRERHRPLGRPRFRTCALRSMGARGAGPSRSRRLPRLHLRQSGRALVRHEPGLLRGHDHRRCRAWIVDRHARVRIAPVRLAETSATSTAGSWLAAVPRIWRTASVTRLSPWM